MSIIAEELIIQIKATAEGLKESIDAVKTEIEKLKELQKETKRSERETDKFERSLRSFELTLQDVISTLSKGTGTYEDYGKVVGGLNGVLTDEASYIGITAEELEKLTTFQSDAADSASALGNAFDDSLTPNLTNISDLLSALNDNNGKFAESQKGLSAEFGKEVDDVGAAEQALKDFTGTVGTAVGAIGIIQKAFSIHPYLGIVVSIGAGIIGIGTAVEQVNEEVETHEQKLEDLNIQMERYNQLIKGGIDESNAEEYIAMAEDMAKTTETSRKALDKYMEKVKELKESGLDPSFWQNHLVGYMDELIVEFEGDTDKINAMLKSIGHDVDIAEALNLETITELSNAFVNLNAVTEKQAKDVEYYNKKVAEQNRLAQEQAKYARQQALLHTDLDKFYNRVDDHSNKLKLLAEAQNELANKQTISGNTMKALIELFPEISQHVANNKNSYEGLRDVLDSVSEKAANSFNKVNERDLERTRTAIQNAQARVDAYLSELRALQALANTSGESIENTEEFRRISQGYSTAQRERESLTNQYYQMAATLAVQYGTRSPLPSSGTSVVAYHAEINSELQKEIDNYNHLTATSEMSAAERVKHLNRIKDECAKTAAEISMMDEMIYDEGRGVIEEYFDGIEEGFNRMNEASVLDIDISGMKAGLDEARGYLLQFAEEYPVTVADMLKNIDDMERQADERKLEQEREISRKVLDEAEKVLDGKLRAIDKEAEYLRAQEGVRLENGEMFHFSTDDELALVKEGLKEISEAKAKHIALYGNDVDKMTEDQAEAYQNLLGMECDYQQRQWQLINDGIREEQRLKEDAVQKDVERAQRDKEYQINKLKEKNNALLDELKAYHDEQVKIAETAAETELKIYQDKIDEIDRLMQEADRIDDRVDYADKLKRLQEQLKFEHDDANKYELQKEIDNMTAEQKKEESRWAMEDEKAKLQEQMDDVKERLSIEKEALKQQLEEEKELLKVQLEQEKALHDLAYEAYSVRLNDELAVYKTSNADKIASNQETMNTVLTSNKTNLKGIEESTSTSQANMKKDNNKFNDDVLTKNKETMINTERAVKSGMGSIVLYLFSILDSFAEVGYQAGKHWAESFNDAAATFAVYRSKDDEGHVKTYRGTPTYDETMELAGSAAKNITQNFTFNTPTVTPSMLSRTTKDIMERAIRL